MKRYGVLLACGAVLAAAAGEPPDDQQLIERAPTQVAPPPASAVPAEDLNQAERDARQAANLAVARLETVLGRKVLATGDLAAAAQHAQRVLALLRDVPADVDVSEFELQAEAMLARAARAGVAPSGDVETPTPTNAVEPQPARRGVPAVARHGYQPAPALVNAAALRADDRESFVYQEALREAYRRDEVRALMEADEARLIPNGIVTYPPDWPERVAKRKKWKDGVIARSPSWYDKDGREWYIAVYDVQDLIYVPPDFSVDARWADPRFRTRDMLDRQALRDGSMIFRGSALDLAAGIPLLRYFGGIDPYAARGPRYSAEKQQELVEIIRAFTGGQVDALPVNVPPER